MVTITPVVESCYDPPSEPLEAYPSLLLDSDKVSSSNSNDEAPKSNKAKSKRKDQAKRDDANENTVNPMTEFVTTSDVLDTINAQLHDMMNPTATTQTTEKQSFFELQKQLPDGSTRKATAEELASQNMKNKLEQAAQLTSKMTLEQKLEWAQQQRQHGNTLYANGDYKEAMDIYLTCLIVRDVDSQIDTTLLLPVMNNLAQCTLQLGWYQKAELFCTLGLESIVDKTKEEEEESAKSNSTENATTTTTTNPATTTITTNNIQVAKLYFKRAKARRLRGEYQHAKIDLDLAQQGLGTNANHSNQYEAEQKALEREYQLLSKAVAEGKKNKKRAQKAMQTVLLGSTDISQEEANNNAGSKTTSATKSNPSRTNAPTLSSSKENDKASATTTPLYPDKHIRTHSTIRKRPEGPPPYPRPTLKAELSYWQIYRLMVARVAQKLLDLIGEEEEDEDTGGHDDGRRQKQD